MQLLRREEVNGHQLSLGHCSMYLPVDSGPWSRLISTPNIHPSPFRCPDASWGVPRRNLSSFSPTQQHPAGDIGPSCCVCDAVLSLSSFFFSVCVRTCTRRVCKDGYCCTYVLFYFLINFFWVKFESTFPPSLYTSYTVGYQTQKAGIVPHEPIISWRVLQYPSPRMWYPWCAAVCTLGMKVVSEVKVTNQWC